MAVDLFPIPFGPFGQTPDPLPPVCPDFLQVGVNVTEFYPMPESADDNPSSSFAWAFYIWNNIRTNITDASRNLVEFVPGETVTITILLNEDGVNATVLYNSTVHGLIQLDLAGGSLCLDSVQWGFGTSSLQQALYGVSDFDDSTATLVNLTTSDIQILGPDSGTRTFVWNDDEGVYYEVFDPTSDGFTWVAEPDDLQY